MKKFALFASLAVAACLSYPQPMQAVEVHNVLTGLYVNAPDAYQGYTLFTPSNGKSQTTYLIDMQGQIVHTWNLPGVPMYAELLPTGNLLVNIECADKYAPFGGEHGRLMELAWDGKPVMDVTVHTPDKVMHHGFDRMPNGNTLVLVWEKKSWDEAKTYGRDSSLIPPDGYITAGGKRIDGIWPDSIHEIDKTGKTVWKWSVWDHLGLGPDKININYVLNQAAFGTTIHFPDWTHFNAVRYNPETDKIVCDSRNFGEIFVIDHKTGKIEWRFGNPGTYGGGRLAGGYGDDGDQQLFGCHDVQWLPNGNLSIFDNGTHRPSGTQSRVLEIDPKTNKIVWQYGLGNNNSNSFYSSYQSSAQKLPNDNYYVNSTGAGHMFEVTPAKEIVWEYINPVNSDGPKCVNGTDLKGNNQVHRSFRYGKDFPAFQGKELKAQGPVNPGCPNAAELMAPYLKK